MRITTLGKVAILLIIAGCIAGAFRFLIHPSNLATNQNQSTGSSGDSTGSNSQGGITLSIQTSGTYQDYAEKLAARLPKENPSIHIKVLPPKESRDALHSILDHSKSGQNEIPDVWLASNDALVQNLSAATKGISSAFANVNDTRTYAIWPPQPMVLLANHPPRTDCPPFSTANIRWMIFEEHLNIPSRTL